MLMTAKETIKWMKEKNHFHCWLMPMNGLQDRKPYDGRPVGNNPEFMPLDNSLNRDILHSFNFHCVLSHFLLDGEGTDEEERNIRFSPLAISFGVDKLKRIFLSSSSVPYPSSTKRLNTQLKHKECKMSLLRLLSKGINSGLLPTGRPA